MYSKKLKYRQEKSKNQESTAAASKAPARLGGTTSKAEEKLAGTEEEQKQKRRIFQWDNYGKIPLARATAVTSATDWPPIGSQEEDSQCKPPAPIPAGIRPVANPTITAYQDPKEPTTEVPKRRTRSENGNLCHWSHTSTYSDVSTAPRSTQGGIAPCPEFNPSVFQRGKGPSSGA
ncbi:hypothetical protein DAPPUDRAFT_115138 [Daphnia pulex]|uniref:Uncharacterized protein n=1 Tax=Daphnia pulex TaxID=6669 RepID=E9HKC9_DAPPU|nr:hypothetical protein DAPPUDRAFT_115138 [Daphnia pulex]|eukprot:EFX67761.1 hypothetical protein DAPPUDRAFT_115138 [Daphnia pulex]